MDRSLIFIIVLLILLIVLFIKHKKLDNKKIAEENKKNEIERKNAIVLSAVDKAILSMNRAAEDAARVADFKDKKFDVDPLLCKPFTVLDETGEPLALLLHEEIYDVACLKFSINNNDFSNPPAYVELKTWMLINNIVQTNQLSRYSGGGISVSKKYLEMKPFVVEPDIMSPHSMSIIRYIDNNKVYEKIPKYKCLYNLYLEKFNNSIIKGTIPTGDEFIEWYDEACIDIVKLNEHEPINVLS